MRDKRIRGNDDVRKQLLYTILNCIYSQTQIQVYIYIYIIYYGQPVSVSLLDHLQAFFQT